MEIMFDIVNSLHDKFVDAINAELKMSVKMSKCKYKCFEIGMKENDGTIYHLIKL